MAKNKIKDKPTVLFLEWVTSGRDFEISFPIMYFFEKKLGWNVEYKSQFNLPSVISSVPDLVIMSDSVGSSVGLEWTRLIETSRIPLFTHVTEGMFRESDIEEFVWGWGKVEKKFSETLSMLWSYRAYKIAIKHYPELKSLYRVSGSVGADKYKLCNTKKNKYSKVVGYAGFDFARIKSNKNSFVEKKGSARYDELNREAKKVNKILKHLIEKNSDIEFLLKPHPGDGVMTPVEFDGLKDFKNVKIHKKISIVDAISASDVWLSYNSSTTLEAWLLGKPTLSFIIDEQKFTSDILFGSITIDEPERINSYIKEFYRRGKINDFDKKSKIRKKLIEKYIAYDDGMNHVRFISHLRPYIEEINKGINKRGKWQIPLRKKLKGYIKHIIYRLVRGKYWLPYLNKWSRFYDIFDEEELIRNKTEYYPLIDLFYKKNAQKIDDLYVNYKSDFEKYVKSLDSEHPG